MGFVLCKSYRNDERMECWNNGIMDSRETEKQGYWFKRVLEYGHYGKRK